MDQVPVWQHRVDRAAQVSTIVLSGALDLTAAPQLRQAVAEELGRPDLACLAIDMAAVSFIDSTAMSILVFAHHAARQAGRQLTISTSPLVQRKLELTGLSGLLDPGDR